MEISYTYGCPFNFGFGKARSIAPEGGVSPTDNLRGLVVQSISEERLGYNEFQISFSSQFLTYRIPPLSDYG